MDDSPDIPAPEDEHAPGLLDVESPVVGEEAPDIPERPHWEPPVRTPLRGRDRAVLILILIASAVAHFARLSVPGAPLPADNEECEKRPPLGAQCYALIPLDEVHYVPDARDVVRFGTDSDTRVPTSDDGAFVVHPPVGKWFMAAGIKIFGDRPFGWRFAGALLGTLSSLIIYAIARRLWDSPWWSALAAAFLAIDGLWLAQSRIAMLDIYAAFFVLLGTWLLLEDRDRASPDHHRYRWWRVGAATSFGFALATKWSVLPFIAMAGLFSLGWELGKMRMAERRRLLARAGKFAGVFGVLPLLLYFATYTPWLLDSHRYSPPRCVEVKGTVAKWGCYQAEIFDFHRNLAKYEESTDQPTPSPKMKPAHPYFGNGYSWPWIGRPVAHFYESSGSGRDQRASEVLGLPNPVIWWSAFFLGLPLLVWWTLWRRDRVAPLLLAMFAAGWLPYVAADLVDRPVFLFYATPLVPFVVLTAVHTCRRLAARFPVTRYVVFLYVAFALAAFAYFYPVVAGIPISYDGVWGWHGRMWFTSDCSVVDRVKYFCWI
ncbi:MAG: phospholipid carrier-dependent glycosyltransferase [Actinomycetota bacterium]